MGGIFGDWDPLGLTGSGGATTAGGILLGPLGFLGGLFGLGGGSEASGGSSSSGGGSETGNILNQIMPLFMFGLVVYLVVKYLPKLLK